MAVWSPVKLGKLPGAFRLDPQYWQPSHVAVEQALRKLPCEPLGELVSTLRKGVFDLPAADYVESGVPFYRSANVGRILPNEASLVYISEQRDEAERKTSLTRGDLMLAKTGDEAASVVLRSRCNVSQDVIALRVKRDRVNPFYLAVFLNTSAGVSQMQRWFQGQSQMHLSLLDTREIIVPIIPVGDQEAIQAMVVKAHAVAEAATEAYSNARLMLDDALGLAFLNLSPQTTFVAKYSEASVAERLDAQFFQPKFEVLRTHLQSLASPTLGSLLSEPVTKGVAPNYVEEGGVSLINSQHLGPTLLDLGSADRVQRASWEANLRARLRLDDILIYATGAYVGRANVLLDEAEALAGLDVLIVRFNPKLVDPIYASVVLNSTVGLMQTDRWATGSAQRHLYPRHLERYLVPVLPRSIQSRIATKVREANTARQAAAQLLDDAKNEVEAMIFGDAGPSAE